MSRAELRRKQRETQKANTATYNLTKAQLLSLIHIQMCIRDSYKCDIKKYYPSVNKRILKRMLRRDIKDNDILYVAFFLIDTYKGGLCIGSYLSQFLANYYLSYAYHYITEQSYSCLLYTSRCV